MTVEREIFINAFPTSLTTEVTLLLDKLNLSTEHKTKQFFQIIIGGQTINIPYRIYYDQPIQKRLTETETFLLNCIFTRHHDGLVREKCLRQIITTDEYLATPFIAQLLGEYVLEILHTIYDNLSPKLLDNFIRFRTENSNYFRKTEDRVLSYWNCYYKRTIPKKLDYVGFKIFKAIEGRMKEIELTDIHGSRISH